MQARVVARVVGSANMSGIDLTATPVDVYWTTVKSFDKARQAKDLLGHLLEGRADLGRLPLRERAAHGDLNDGLDAGPAHRDRLCGR
jgi:hypothetical protein